MWDLRRGCEILDSKSYSAAHLARALLRISLRDSDLSNRMPR
jgi:hypothetical protein